MATPAPRTRPQTRTAAKPAPKSRPKARTKASAKAKRHTHARGAIAWIVVSALLLAGVVFVNLAVLRLNLSLDTATQERSKLRAENAALASQLSSALASPKIQSRARSEYGLVRADSEAIGYIALGR